MTTKKIVLLDGETTDKQCLLKSYLVSLYFCILLSSLEWDKYQWNGIGGTTRIVVRLNLTELLVCSEVVWKQMNYCTFNLDLILKHNTIESGV